MEMAIFIGFYYGGQLVCYFKLVKSELILLSLLSSEK